MALPNTIRLAGVISDSIVDGPGLRLSVFVQGCPHHCVGCHNPETHDPNGGYEKQLTEFVDEVVNEFKCNPLLAGITFSGGEPIEQISAVLVVARAVKTLGKDVALFSGYTFEELLDKSRVNTEITELLSLTTLFVDGKFVLQKRDLTLTFRGSRNQRLLNAKQSIESGMPIEWHSKFAF